MMGNEVNLLPCPFCGSEALHYDNGYATCGTYRCPMNAVVVKNEAWNTRTEVEDETSYNKGWRLAKEGHGLSNLWGNCSDDSEMDEVYRGMKAYWNSVK